MKIWCCRKSFCCMHCAESLDVNTQALRIAFRQSCRIAKCGLVMSKNATTARVHYVNATSFSFPRPSLTAHSLTLRQMSGQAPHFYLSAVDKAFTVAIPRLWRNTEPNRDSRGPGCLQICGACHTKTHCLRHLSKTFGTHTHTRLAFTPTSSKTATSTLSVLIWW